MRPHRELKIPRGVADSTHMHPGGWSGRRRLLALCLSLSTGLSLAAGVAVPASAAAGSQAKAKAAAQAAVGEAGSGAPEFPFVIPHAAQRRTAAITWSDVPHDHWGKNGIDFVGKTYNWMRDYKANADGSYPFKPERMESRKLFARAMVRAFAPGEAMRSSITFRDLPSDSTFFRFANVAVKLGWMRKSGGKFLPDDPVTMALVHHAIVYALGLKADAVGANHIHTHNGFEFRTQPNFGSTLIGMRLGLRFNHSDESLDVHPSDSLSRTEVAWSLYRAKTLPQYSIDAMDAYANIELPTVGPKKQAFIQWGINYVGYPYVWGGDWDKATGSGYCCGTQPIGGFDCSGLSWWILKHSGAGWDNHPPRPYAGWDLPQRTSALMATVGNIGWNRLAVGNLMFYDGDDDGTVDHVDTFIGNGWSLDSGSSNAGVTITFTGEGSWYQDHFVHGRNIMG